MSEAHGHGPNWYKLFVSAILVFDTVLIIMVGQCTLGIENPFSAFNSFVCISYSVFVFLSLLLGIFVSSIGIEHARRNGKNRHFYYFAIIYLLTSSIALLGYKLL